MPGINEMIRRMESVNMNETIQLAVAGTVGEYEKLQKLQMLLGKDSSGGVIGKYKNQKYARAKHAINPLAGLGNMDFKLTGDFYKQFFTRLGSNAVLISSTDKKTERLLKINKDVFGLNSDSAKEYSISYIKPEANNLIKRQLTGHVM